MTPDDRPAGERRDRTIRIHYGTPLRGGRPPCGAREGAELSPHWAGVTCQHCIRARKGVR